MGKGVELVLSEISLVGEYLLILARAIQRRLEIKKNTETFILCHTQQQQ